MAKKKTVEKALNLDSILFNCRDYLRAARNSGSFFEKRDMMLTLVFLDNFKNNVISQEEKAGIEQEITEYFSLTNLQHASGNEIVSICKC